MAFKMSVQKYSGKISEVEIGKGEKAIKIGGESTLPFYSFDGNTGNTQKVGVEMLDVYPEGWTNEFKEMYKDVCDCPVKWAKYIEENLKADFICLKLESSDPNGLDRSPEECAEVAKNVVESVSLPVVIAGCGNHEKDAKVFEKVSQAVDGNNCLFLAATEDNYKAVGAATTMAYSHKVVAESSVDINLAKQLNVLLTQLGVKPENIVMQIGCSAVGYGYEYGFSIMEKVRLEGEKGDKYLDLSLFSDASTESLRTKEAKSDDYPPSWGELDSRAQMIEVSACTGAIAAGANIIVVNIPSNIQILKELI